ncbi:MAG: sulfatase-like hydrolase/transferase [Planctomycetota bacterium]|nr:sulfatase-like hydrolase/transferase [Planctomycetota bacterium]
MRSPSARRPRALTTGVLLLLPLGCAGPRRAVDAAAPARPNVLLIAIDDLRADHTDALESGTPMPRVRAFARTAAEFREHHVQAPSCGPSRAALLTGRDPARSRALQNDALYGGPSRLSAEAAGGARTLPELMRRNGLTTTCIGKISHTPDGRVYAYDGSGDGRDELPDAWDELLTPFGPWGRGWGAFFAYPGGAHREDGESSAPLVAASDPDQSALPDELIADVACDRIERFSATEERFFLAVGFFKPHLPWVAPALDLETNEGRATTQSATRVKTPYLHGSGEFRRYDAPWGEGLPAVDSKDEEEARAAYAGCARFTDRQVGRVLDALEEAGLAESTIVVLWSDHGFHLGESGVWGKHTLLDRSLHSPMMIRAPGVTVPGPRDGLAATVDLYPTLVELCGLEDRATRHPLDGVDLGPVLRDPRASVREVTTAYWGRAATARSREHRLLARWREGAWRDLRLIDATRPDPTAEELTTAISAEGEVPARLLRHLVPPPGASRANSE